MTYVIGITGGVASGKSTLAELFARQGAAIVRADEIAHEVLLQKEVVDQLVARWGESVLQDERQINRQAVARIVFAPGPGGRAQREFLESITHPRITRIMQQQVERARAAGAPAVVLDAPLLVEAGWDDYCDRIIFADASRPIRLARARSRGWSQEVFDAREDAQETLNAKRERADAVIDNSGSEESAAAQVAQFWQTLVG